ncbi:hypothetical protein ACWDZ4_26590 [Streptomyces sp. NPDC003016]
MSDQTPSQAEGEREDEEPENARQTTPSQAEGERDDNEGQGPEGGAASG